MTEEKYGDSYGEKFRQYEDKIKELEKENEKLKGQMSLHEGLLWNDLHKLEKENAELKAVERMALYSKMSDQLAKAKQIMKRLVDLSNSSRSLLGSTWHETVREAEDFLKETEE